MSNLCVDFPVEQNGIHFCMSDLDIDESSLSLSDCGCVLVGQFLRGEDLKGPGHLFSENRFCSGIQNLYIEEIRVFQACACGEEISMEQKGKIPMAYVGGLCARSDE